MTDANAFLQAAQRVTMLLGPVLAGFLITAVGAPSVLLVDAATFAFALGAIALFVPATERPAPTEESRGLLAGLRYLARDRVLRAWTVSVAVGDAAWSALFATLPFYAFEEYDGNAKLAGLLRPPRCGSWSGRGRPGSWPLRSCSRALRTVSSTRRCMPC